MTRARARNRWGRGGGAGFDVAGVFRGKTGREDESFLNEHLLEVTDMLKL
jgi:hypothetical protein